MQQLKSAVAVFCTACIYAELVARLLGNTKSRQCIKAVAGLYILIAVFRTLPKFTVSELQLEKQGVQAADFGTAEDAILYDAARRLEETLEARLLDETGQPIQLELILVKAEDGVKAIGVQVLNCPEQAKHTAQELLCRELGLDSVQFEE